MIDIHCHVVPEVDDGPSSIEEAEKMLDIMYEDGIRGVIATSHRNHPLDFSPASDYESSLERVKKLAKTKYPDMEIYSGAEFYVRDGYLDVLDSNPYDLTLNKTKYVLLEFEAGADYETVSDAVYEFKIRKYKPVLAHIDKYQALYEDFDSIEKLRKEGAYIQVTGATLVGKYGNSLKKKMIKLLKGGYIDFIGTDGHSPEKRRPLLRRSYKVVEKYCSKVEAERIFVKNPASLIEDGSIIRMSLRKPVFSLFYKFKPVYVWPVLLFLISIAVVVLSGGR
jgi:protein-tyrosine phosphatase